MSSAHAVVVTHNRCVLLRRCLDALQHQSCPPAAIVVIDNASSDGTREMMEEVTRSGDNAVRLIYRRLEDNLGGAGGFAEGLRVARDDGCEWAWMMDDDAEPHHDALERLLAKAVNPQDVYGSLAVCGEETSWITTLVSTRPAQIVDRAEHVPDLAQVQSLPFLGFLVHRRLVERIGLPDAGYFIAADDVEYCMRAQRAGARIFVCGESRIAHPASIRYQARLPGRTLTCLKLPPWKRYYDTRNRLLIARDYHGHRMLTQTLPGSFVRFVAALMHEPDRWQQTRAFLAGLIDGLLGRKGARHRRWRIS